MSNVQESLKSEDVYIFDINQPFVTQEQKFKYWEESKAEIKRLKAALSEIDKYESIADTLRFLKSHDCVDDEGYEYGICKVKFDNSGKAAEVLWSDIDAVIKLKTKKGIV